MIFNDEKLNNINSTHLNLDGGLGNQIFQFLAGKYVQKLTKCSNFSYRHVSDANPSLNKLIFDKHFVHLNKLQTNLNSSLKNKIIRKVFCLYKEVDILFKFFKVNILSDTFYIKEYYRFSSEQFSLQNRINNLKKVIKKIKVFVDLEISGFWQDPTPYLHDLKSLSEEFEKNLLFDKKNLEFKPGTYITLHARRGDYLNVLSNAKMYASNHSFISFISSSINILPSEFDDLPIIIVSDDQEWFKNIKISRLSNIKRDFLFASGSEVDDWILMNNARINIISNSTFSYTASLLNRSNSNSKLRAIMPFWYSLNETTNSKGWLKPNGFIGI
tara:strand:+ start:272 stop:1258 length:987 start_codon:yes stop_codon:yes gene_type:complete